MLLRRGAGARICRAGGGIRHLACVLSAELVILHADLDILLMARRVQTVKRVHQVRNRIRVEFPFLLQG